MMDQERHFERLLAGAGLKATPNRLLVLKIVSQAGSLLMLDEASGELTPRGQTIIDHTPMGRFGDPEDLLGAVLWLISPASAFVTGVVVPIDGGFMAFGGV